MILQSQRSFLATTVTSLAILSLAIRASAAAEQPRPNILFAFADDWGRCASIYAETDGPGGINDVVRTPNFDRLAKRGVLFRNAYVNAPSCTPCRSSLLSGQYFWRTGRGAILRGAVWDSKIPSWPLLLYDADYHIGKTFKVWSPGVPVDAPYGGRTYAFRQAGGRFNGFSQTATKLVAAGQSLDDAKSVLFDEVRGNFKHFLDKRDKDQPFCYWFGPTNVHRKWIKGSGKKLWDIDPDSLKGKMPPFLPDVAEVRQDLADYFGEVAAFDAALGILIDQLKAAGELDNTLIVVSGDHGPPGFPHGKCNLYDFGTGVPLAISGPGVKGGRVVDDFVNLPDLAPTFLETAGAAVPDVMTAKSLWPTLKSDKSGLADSSRTYVLTGRERHVENARAGNLPYPQRAIRTASHQLVINFRPDRNPLGDPYRLSSDNPPTISEVTENTRVTLPDEDAGPTKAWLVNHRNDPKWKNYFDHAYGKRPRIELFDMKQDPHQMKNIAADPANAEVVAKLSKQLLDELKRTGDPRLVDNGKFFETPPMAGPVPADAQRQRRKPMPPKAGVSKSPVKAGMGIMVGEVTPTSAVAQVRLTQTNKLVKNDVPGIAGVVRFTITTKDNKPQSTLVKAQAEHDFIARIAWKYLSPNIEYIVRTEIGSNAESLTPGPTATFRTSAGPYGERAVKFVVVTGMNYAKFHGDERIDRKIHLAHNNTDLPKPYAGPDKHLGYPALDSIRRLKPDFFVGTGDNVYYDTPKKPRAETIPELRQKWHEQFVQPRFRDLFAVVPTYWMIDDHDFRIDDSDNTGDYKPSPAVGRQLMLEQLPLAAHKETDAKTYRTHRISKDLQIWFPENRMYRSPNTMKDGPGKTIWGAEQKAWLKKTLAASNATFKILVSPNPMIGPDDARKIDNHTNISGFQHERDEFFAWLKESGVAGNFYLVCGDRHWQYHSIDSTGIEEFSCGALVDANSRPGRKPGDPKSTDPKGLIKQVYSQKKPSGGFLLIESMPTSAAKKAALTFKFHDEKGMLLHEHAKRAK